MTSSMRWVQRTTIAHAQLAQPIAELSQGMHSQHTHVLHWPTSSSGLRVNAGYPMLTPARVPAPIIQFSSYNPAAGIAHVHMLH